MRTLLQRKVARPGISLGANADPDGLGASLILEKQFVRREAEVYVSDAPKPRPQEKAMHGDAGHKMAWKVDGNNVYPVNDLREHLLAGCWCRPTDDDGIMVHNSFDGRELYERGERKVS